MDLNFITLVIIVILLVYMIYSRARMFNEHEAGLEIVKERKDIKKLFTGQTTIAIYAFIMIAAVVGAVIIYLNKSNIEDSQSWLLVCAIIFTFLATDLVRVNVIYTTYYNDHGMYVESDYIRFNSIKDYNQKKVPIFTDLTTFNNKEYKIPTKTLRALKETIKAKNRK